MPTSTHGGIQLWYGTLQVGPYLESRAHNPRSIFDSPPLPYTSLTESPMLIGAARNGVRGRRDTGARLLDRSRHESPAGRPPSADGDSVRRSRCRRSRRGPSSITSSRPSGESRAADIWRPLQSTARRVHSCCSWTIVTSRISIDTRTSLDVFDRRPHRASCRLAGSRPIAAQTWMATAPLTRRICKRLHRPISFRRRSTRRRRAFRATRSRATLRLGDGSRIAVPRQWRGRQTDLDVEGNLAGALVSRSRSRSSLAATPASTPVPARR